VTRLAIVSSHPIQYNAPAFRALSAERGIEVRVFYGWEGPGTSQDREFGRRVEWDIPLLDGYDYEFMENVSSNPGSHRFRGIDNPEMVARIRDWRPSVLLVYGWSFASHLRVLRAFHGSVPILFRGDSTLLDERAKWRAFARRIFLRWVYKHVDVALFTGTLNRAYFSAHGLREDQLVWAPHAVDNRRFQEETEEREAEALTWRRQLGIADGDVVFLFAGKLVPRKGPALLLDAFNQLRESSASPRGRLIFVGEGEQAAGLRAETTERSDVCFLGFQNQSAMPVIYRLGNVMIMPSRYGETWGLAVNEAMACSRPVIVSDRVGCAVDLVRTGETGFNFAHDDATGLRDAMRKILMDRVAGKAMGERAAALIKHWSISRYASIVAEIARSLDGTGARDLELAPDVAAPSRD
jgi:glycosyltransferase involved in cell wall biosynthesis